MLNITNILTVGVTNCLLLNQVDIKNRRKMLKQYRSFSTYFLLKTPKFHFIEINKNLYKMAGVKDNALSTISVNPNFKCSLHNNDRLLKIYDFKENTFYERTVFDILLEQYGNSEGSLIFNYNKVLHLPDEVRMPFISPFEIIYIGKTINPYRRLRNHEKIKEAIKKRILYEYDRENTDHHILLYSFEALGIKENTHISIPIIDIVESLLIDYFKPSENHLLKEFNIKRELYKNLIACGYERVGIILDCTANIETRFGNIYSLVLPLSTTNKSTYNNFTGKYDVNPIISKGLV